MKDIVVVTDNTLGMPTGEIDDGLAILYLLGCSQRVRVSAICTTHGNAASEWTYRATHELARALRPLLDGVPIAAGANAPRYGMASTHDRPASDAAHLIAQSSRPGASLLSLGATTDLAAAEALHPGALAGYDEVALMGGTTSTLVVGGRVMDELNFSVDGLATYRVFSTAAPEKQADTVGNPNQASSPKPANLLLADAWNCMPLTFGADEFLDRLAQPGMPGADFLRACCTPWFDHAAREWNTHGFVGWDVLAAMALAEPELLQLVPYEVALNERLLDIGYLEAARPGVAAAHVNLVAPKDPAQAVEHIYLAWGRALARLA